MKKMKTGAELIARERQDQIEKHGYSLEYDAETHPNYELCWAAASLLCVPDNKPIADIDFIVTTKLKKFNKGVFFKTLFKRSYKERLVIAAALLAAEIDRVQGLYEEENLKIVK